MQSRHLVDPQLRELLDAWPSLELTVESLPVVREQSRLEFLATMPAESPFPEVEVSEVLIDGPAGPGTLRILVISPRSRPASATPGLLWVHGGGYVLGTADQDSLQVQQLVHEIGCTGVVVDYRLAPETPHPGPVEDCYAALLWVFANAAAVGVDARRIAVAGASAGGGLAAALCLLARDRAEVAVAFQLLIYPMLDDRTVVDAAPHPFAGEFVWTADSNRFGWAALLGQEPGSPGVSPYAAPARAETLAGLPPTYLDVGTLDLFFEEDLEYARRLVRAGVPVELHVYPGAFHGYQRAPASDAAGTHHQNVVSALRRALSVA